MDQTSSHYSNDHVVDEAMGPTADRGHGSFQLDSLMETPSSPSDGQLEWVYIQGPRFWAISAAIWISMFLVFLEIPVVITALVEITSELGGFDRVGWVVAAYLMGYIAVIVIFAKFSDIFGRKFVFLLSSGIFIIFSAACGASQTMNQVIIFRAFQGIGGGGCFSLCTIMMIEVVPPEKYTQYLSYISVSNALSLLLGPIIGGAIAQTTTWRWIFLINVPIASVAFVVAFVSIPREFPYQGQAKHFHPAGIRGLASRTTLERVDIPGTIILLLAVVGLTAGFEEADSLFPWRSAYVISLLTISGILWIILLFWEHYVTKADKVREPVLPWRFLTNRQMVGLLLNLFLLGGPTLIGIFLIPQRLQLIYGLSGLDAGVRLIPFTLALPVATIFASGIAGKRKVPIMYILIVGSIFQVIGLALLGTLPLTKDVPSRFYGFEILAGWGCGLNYSLLLIAIPIVNSKRDHAVGMGTGSQFRMVGSSIMLAISTSVFNSYVRPELSKLLDPAQVNDLIHSGEALSLLQGEVREQVRHAFAEGYNRQSLVLCVAAALQIPATLLLWKRANPLTV
ncbi:putative multidrug resistance protein fnx1 [Xylariomycetidae sp. FL2044]|nr:putative multidrug resistance protein fnx1 [Xylariomycetidae sp. FL2044]